MTFLWPPLLLLLLLLPVGVWGYRRRERQRAARVAAVGLAAAGVASAAAGVAGGPGGRDRAGPSRGWRRRIPGALMVVGLGVLVFSLARPQSVIGVPRLEGTVMLLFDVSGSMAATDVQPSRLEVAKKAARGLLEDQPPSVRIGIIVFSDSGLSTLPPSSDRADIETAIDRLQPERGTAIGSGIASALTAIEDVLSPRTTDYYTNDAAPRPSATPVPAGVYEPAVVVLLTDGEDTTRSDPVDAAQAARDRGIRIDTVGVGTTAGTTLEREGFQVHTALEEDVLKQIAATTDGTYHAAADDTDLKAIYDDVGSRLTVESEPFELTALLAMAGLVLLVVGAAASLRWLGRVP